MISGSFQAMNFGKYAYHYLAKFTYRFNRRFDLARLVTRLIVDASRSGPSPLPVIPAAEAHF